MTNAMNDPAAIDELIDATKRRFVAEISMLNVIKVLADGSISRNAREQISLLLVTRKAAWNVARTEYDQAVKAVSKCPS